jgi:hypothetical protein
MLSRNAPESVSDNPLIDSPYNLTYQKGLGTFPVNNDWLLLDNDFFSTLEGPHFAFLGP